MKLTIELDGKPRTVELVRAQSGRFNWLLDGVAIDADASEIHSGEYSILIGGQSLEVHVEPKSQSLLILVGNQEFSAAVRDPREWRRKQSASLSSHGRQQVLAPMPGKVIRVLVKAGEKIKVGQGIIVVEAMKMQNEVRVSQSGQIEKILVTEGQSVNATDILAVIV